MSAIIQVDRLAKRYRIGRPLNRNNNAKPFLEKLSFPFRYLIDTLRPESEGEIIWALQDISFKAQEGEVIGIIGRNGAGKSTLLKILSRITEPTSGKAVIHGRVGSLLEVGTGFHPELTGRENIYLNGTILGMKRKEILKRFDEIVAFAEIERFLDTPIKRYSSGMYVRLAFAVAANLETEILLIDEVLAVGDANFQKRCLSKMGDVAKQGRTILFVSHNMNAVQRLCTRAIMIDHGKISFQGNPSEIIIKYLSNCSSYGKPNEWITIPSLANRSGTQEAHFTAIMFSSNDETVKYQPYPDSAVEFQFIIKSDRKRLIDSIAVSLNDNFGLNLVNADSVTQGQIITVHKGFNKITLVIHSLHLNPGTYVIGLWLANRQGDIFDYIPAAISMEIIDYRPGEIGVGTKADGIIPCKFDISVVKGD